MDDQAIQSVTYTDTARLCVVYEGLPFFLIPLLVEIGMADTGSCLDHRDTGIVANEVNQRTAAAGYDQVYQSDGIQQFGCRFSVRWQQATNSRVYAMTFQHLMDDTDQCPVRVVSI